MGIRRRPRVRARERPRPRRGDERGGGERRGGLGRRSAEDLDAEELDDEDLDDPELEALLRSMPPEMFEQFLREDARAGGEAGEEAAALVALLEEMGMQGVGAAARARRAPGGGARAAAAAAAAGGRAARSARGSGASPAGPGEGGGGGGGAGARRARARHAGQRVPPREKGWVSRGPGRRRRTARARILDPETRAGGSEDFFFSSQPRMGPPGLHAGVAHGEEQAQEGAQEDEREEKDTEKDTEKEGSVHEGSVTREMHEDADDRPSNAAEGVAWAPDAFCAATTRRRDGLGQQRRRASTDADAAKVDREVSRRWVAAAKAGDVAALRGVLETFAGGARARSRVSSAKSTLDAVLEHRSPGIGHTALHWSASRGIDALDATAWLLDVCLDDVIETNDEKTETNAARKTGVKKARKSADSTRTRATWRAPRLCTRRRGSGRWRRSLCSQLQARTRACGTRRGKPRRTSRRGGARVVQLPGVPRRRGGFFARRSRNRVRGFRDGPRRDGLVGRERARGWSPAGVGAWSERRIGQQRRRGVASREARRDVRRGEAQGERGVRGGRVREGGEAVHDGDPHGQDEPRAVFEPVRRARGLGKYEDALADAERCVRMSPKWGKGYGRRARR